MGYMARRNFEKAEEAINAIFSDTGVPIEDTREHLYDLRDLIDDLMESLS